VWGNVGGVSEVVLVLLQFRRGKATAYHLPFDRVPIRRQRPDPVCSFLSILICGSTCRTSFINRLMRLCASPVCCPSILSSVWLVLSSSSSSVPVTGLSVLLWSLSSSLLSSFSFCQVLKSSAAVFVFGSSSSRQLSIDMVVPLWCPL